MTAPMPYSNPSVTGLAAVEQALRGDWLDARVTLHLLSEDDLADLANDLDDLRRMIDEVPDPRSERRYDDLCEHCHGPIVKTRGGMYPWLHLGGWRYCAWQPDDALTLVATPSQNAESQRSNEDRPVDGKASSDG